MAVNLSIKNVPDHIAEQLRRQASKHHRSLQGELMAILEEGMTRKRSLKPSEILSELRRDGLRTPDESARFVREDRNARSSR
jgi:plasmid stability protein